MLRKYKLYFIIIIIAIVIVWSIILSRSFQEQISLQNILNSFSQLIKQIPFTGIIILIVIWCVSVLLRILRFHILGYSQGVKIQLKNAAQASLIGRLVTLITPTVLIGGQPVSYYILVNEGIPRKKSIVIVLLAAVMDLIALLLIVPFGIILLYPLLKSILSLSSVRFVLITTAILAILFILVLVIKSSHIALYLSKIFKLFNKNWNVKSGKTKYAEIQTMIRQSFNKKKSILILAFLNTILILITQYTIIWMLFVFLNQIRLNLESFYLLALKQIICTTLTMFFSPGAGTGVGEFSFIFLISPKNLKTFEIPLILFWMFSIYWSHIILGLIIALFYNQKNSIAFCKLGRGLIDKKKSMKIELHIPNCEKSPINIPVSPAGEFVVKIKYSGPAIVKYLRNSKNVFEKKINLENKVQDILFGE